MILTDYFNFHLRTCFSFNFTIQLKFLSYPSTTKLFLNIYVNSNFTICTMRFPKACKKFVRMSKLRERSEVSCTCWRLLEWEAKCATCSNEQSDWAWKSYSRKLCITRVSLKEFDINSLYGHVSQLKWCSHEKMLSVLGFFFANQCIIIYIFE